MKKALLILSFITVLFSGCDNSEFQSVGDAKPISKEIIKDSGRFDLKKIQTFSDTDSYNYKRSVYILIDKETGKEFVGVSGVGISELSTHTSGKTTIEDER